MSRPHGPRPIDRPTRVPLEPTADLRCLDDAKTFAAPDDPRDWAAWRSNLARWRLEARERLGYVRCHGDDRAPPYALAFVQLWDEALYDHASGRFDVERFLAAAQQTYGGVDGVLLWHAYPVIGIDERRQLDFVRDIPELVDVVAAFQERGVRVYLSHLPWASGPLGHDDVEVAETLAWLGADGLFIDTAREGTPALMGAVAERGLDVSIGGESHVPLARLADHGVSWAQYFADSDVPGVLRSRWFEQAHMLHHTRRWHVDHLEELHSAWINGSGVLLWENVFGVWVGWNARDRGVHAAMRAVQRSHGAWFRHGQWTPLADHPGAGVRVYASRWEHDGATLWTIVNRGGDHDGPWLRCAARPDAHWVDLVTGRRIEPEPVGNGVVDVGGYLPAGAIAAVVAGPGPTALGATPRPHARTHAARDLTTPLRCAVRRPRPSAPVPRLPPTMAGVAGGHHALEVRYRVRECALYGEVPFVNEWKPPLGAVLHREASALRSVDLTPFGIDCLDVSNAEFAAFLSATGYRPTRPTRFVAHWPADGPSAEQADAPVTNVDLADARAFAAWRNARLPSEDEWQLAGECGLLQRRTPRVWNLTESEHSDGRTRFVIVKGGSDFEDTSSEWCFDGGPRPPAWSAKLIVLAGGLSRSPWVGFRCAVDLPTTPA